MKPKALLLVMMDSPASAEEEFNAWYNTEHLPQRLSLPGFEAGTRWVCLEGWPKWLALYDLRSIEVLATPEYAAASGSQGTPWSRRVLARTSAYRRVVAAAVGENGAPFSPSSVSRLVLARYTDVAPETGNEEVAALRERLTKHEGFAAVRCFQESGDIGCNLWIIAAIRGPLEPAGLYASLGRVGDQSATLFNIYVPYYLA